MFAAAWAFATELPVLANAYLVTPPVTTLKGLGITVIVGSVSYTLMTSTRTSTKYSEHRLQAAMAYGMKASTWDLSLVSTCARAAA